MTLNKVKLLLLFFFISNAVFSQIELNKYHVYYKKILKIKTVENDTLLTQSMLKKDLKNGEYIIYYDKALKKQWLWGTIINKKLEGKWEFRKPKREIFHYAFFNQGDLLNIKRKQNDFAKIYLPNKIFQFKAIYINPSRDTVSISYPTLHVESQIFEIRNNERYEGTWTFNYSKEDSLKLGIIYPWNEWEETTLCRIDETKSFIQIYPPRRNQYAFTEIINFPSISPKNLYIGYKWNSPLTIPDGYRLKEWENNVFNQEYEIKGRKNYLYKNQDLVCWEVLGKSYNPKFGTSTIEYLFHSDYGFVRMEWINYDNQKAIFELIDIKIN